MLGSSRPRQDESPSRPFASAVRHRGARDHLDHYCIRGRHRFDFRIVSADGKVLRELSYNRQEVETTYKELHDPKYDPDRQPPQQLDADQARKREDVKKRIEAVVRLFPKRDGEEPAKK